MVVITLTDCPPALRGDLTKWLFEINVGVYVGQVSARVRDELWNRILDNVKVGRVTMVYQTNNEQRLAFRVHNSCWKPIDFDGLTLMMRPTDENAQQIKRLKPGYSKAAKMQVVKQIKAAEIRKAQDKAQNESSENSYAPNGLNSTNPDSQVTRPKPRSQAHSVSQMPDTQTAPPLTSSIPKPSTDPKVTRDNSMPNKPKQAPQKVRTLKSKTIPDCVIIDLETTGLNEIDDDIIEIGAIKIKDGKMIERFHKLIAIDHKIPEFIIKLTGITDEMLSDGENLEDALKEFSGFVESHPLVAHNISFDMAFLNHAFMECNLQPLNNKTYCTLELSRHLLPALKSHKLKSLKDYFWISSTTEHRSLSDCESVFYIYQKLWDLQ